MLVDAFAFAPLGCTLDDYFGAAPSYFDTFALSSEIMLLLTIRCYRSSIPCLGWTCNEVLTDFEDS